MLSAKLGRYYNYIELMPRMTKLKKKRKHWHWLKTYLVKVEDALKGIRETIIPF